MEKTISFSSVLTERLIELDLKGQSKIEVIDELIELLYNAESISDKDIFKQDVLTREEEGMTGIGDGIAIPHGKSDAVLKTSLAIGISKHDIDWDSIDAKPVRIVIMLAIKAYDKTAHIKLLSKVASSLCESDVIEKLINAKTEREIIETFENGEE
ncbi:PTS transporter subunit EIIA [Erysipelothrix sp. HDW6A]|uniref:PTS sugar transporter subunit IIA n=1 Tax=Erysipelothrix sp. HDW6A TaxID=2714928 RepID=UPI00140D43CC|nr:fructose PTS transporter subunit IIA [Erysipelothrix sp. HDW6A]QIK56891.1 PTS transporter subunit EIIA [Erysipelothrix sp. HDW6A]